MRCRNNSRSNGKGGFACSNGGARPVPGLVPRLAPFDATLKDLVEAFPADYAAVLGLADLAPLGPLNVDLSTAAAPDKLCQLETPGSPSDRSIHPDSSNSSHSSGPATRWTYPERLATMAGKWGGGVSCLTQP